MALQRLMMSGGITRIKTGINILSLTYLLAPLNER